MEGERLPPLDLWQSCVSPNLSLRMIVHSFPEFTAGVGKSVIRYALYRLLLWQDAHNLDKLCHY